MTPPVTTVTIVGAGVQGSMLAFRCAIHGKRVAVFDVDAAALEKARDKTDAWLAEFVEKGKLEGFRELGVVEDYDEESVRQAVEAFGPVMGGRSHDEYLAWRDHMVMQTRLLKRGAGSGRTSA